MNNYFNTVNKYFTKIPVSIVFFILGLAFTLSFYNNFFKVTNDTLFGLKRIDSEEYVIGRLSESKQNGISSKYYRLGLLRGGCPIESNYYKGLG